MDNHCTFCPEISKDLSHRSDKIGVKDTQELYACRCRGGQGSKYVKDRPDTQTFPHPPNLCSCPVEGRCKHEANAKFPDGPFNPSWFKFNPHACSFQYIRTSTCPCNCPVTVLCNLHPCSRGYYCSRGAYVKGPESVTPCPAGIHNLHGAGDVNMEGSIPHGPCKTRYLLNGFALHCKGCEDGCHLDIIQFTLHYHLHESIGLILTEIAEVHDPLKEFFKAPFPVFSHFNH